MIAFLKLAIILFWVLFQIVIFLLNYFKGYANYFAFSCVLYIMAVKILFDWIRDMRFEETISAMTVVAINTLKLNINFIFLFSVNVAYSIVYLIRFENLLFLSFKNFNNF